MLSLNYNSFKLFRLHFRTLTINLLSDWKPENRLRIRMVSRRCECARVFSTYHRRRRPSNRTGNHKASHPYGYVCGSVASCDFQRSCRIRDTETNGRLALCYANDDDSREPFHQGILLHIHHKQPFYYDEIPYVCTQDDYLSDYLHKKIVQRILFKIKN